MQHRRRSPLTSCMSCGPRGGAGGPPITDTMPDQWDRTFIVNVCGAFLCYHEATQRLVDRDLLVVQHMGSLRPGYDAYVATKAVVEAMTRVLAKELVGTRITTNSVPKTMLVYISIQQMPWDLQDLIRLLNGSGEVTRFGWLG
jgi:NAD(P)-dependent dehydrogenase (short-subunit alcohol dehydrogenase family)